MAKIYRRSTDRNGQTVADVECRNQDVARHMIAGGWAWVYDGATELGDAPLYKAQDVVRDARQGLWRDPAAVAPWKWRKQEGEARKRNSAPGDCNCPAPMRRRSRNELQALYSRAAKRGCSSMAEAHPPVKRQSLH